MFRKLRSQHINESELKSLLDGDSDAQIPDEVSDHLASCLQCQKALESMAARPDIWMKAPELNSEPSISPMSPSEFQNISESKEIDGHPGRPAQDILDAPSHPDWMGSIDGYEVECEIGRGGMGIVFRAYDRELNRPIAIKVLAPWLAQNGAARQRFTREARAVAAVIHPNVVAIYGVNSRRTAPYIVMPFVAGPSLQELIDQRGPLEVKDIVRIAMQVASGLAAAHAQGIVHRDIKPANILVEADVSRVLVTDFGLARAVDDASATQSGYFVGTPNYMSPEQALGRQVDIRSDLFSLGSVLYFMSTGRMPFRADSPISVLHRISNDQPTSVRQVNSDISETLSQIIGKLHEKNPEDRFQSAGELYSVLEKYLVYLHQPDHSKPPIIQSSTKQKNSLLLRKRVVGVSIIVGLVMAIVAFENGWITVRDWASFYLTDSTVSEEGDLYQTPPSGPSPSSDSIKPTPGSVSSGAVSGSGSGNSNSAGSVSYWPEIEADYGIPGKLVNITMSESGQAVDGYSIYLPKSFAETRGSYPVLMCLQGGSSVGGELSRVNQWGVPLHLQKNYPLGSRLGQYLQDTFIIISPHIRRGEYYDEAHAIHEILNDTIEQYRGDPSQIYITGLSRGGTGVWGLASSMPDVFAAAVPVGGRTDGIHNPSDLQSISLWVVHNAADDVVPFQPVANVISKLENITGQAFHKVDSVTAMQPSDMQHARILTSPRLKDHDAWNALYGSAIFYEWLLRQKLTN